MKRSSRWVAMALATCAWCSTRSANAQTEPTSSAPPATSAAPAVDPEQLARQLFEDSVRMLQDGRYRDAIEVLERARALREVPAILYNLTLALRGVGRIQEAIRTLRRYQELAAERLDDDRRAAVRTLLEAMQHDLGHVTFHIAGVGVTVTLDGQPMARSSLDAPVDVDPGTHVFRGEGNGLRPFEVTREVPRGGSVDVSLAPERITVITALSIASTVPASEVFVDRVLAGQGRYEGEIRPGRHEVSVRARGFLPYETLVMLRPGQIVTLQARLTRNAGWYSNRWLWLGLGAVSVGITATVIGIAASGPSDPIRGTGPLDPIEL